MHQRVKEKKMKIIPGGNQMSLIRDTEEVVKFLEFASRKSILNEHAVSCRLTACHNLFSVLNEEEDNLDYILANLDVLIHRFRNKNTTVQASTLKVYKSRVKSSLEDFKDWSADPFAWERSLTDRVNRVVRQEARKEKKQRKAKRASAPAEPKAKGPVEPKAMGKEVDEVRKVSFPISGDFSVEMTLPAGGLTLSDLHRLGLFLYPYCRDIEPKKIRGPWSVTPSDA